MGVAIYRRCKKEITGFRERQGIRLKCQRVRANKSLVSMAAEMSYTAAYISKVERGIHAPTTDFIAEYARAINIPAAELVVDLRPGEESGHGFSENTE